MEVGWFSVGNVAVLGSIWIIDMPLISKLMTE